MLVTLIAAALVVAVVVIVVGGFNKLRKADIAAQEALGGIDVHLTRRADLVPNLLATVKGYAAHETAVLESVTAARTQVQSAAAGTDVPAKAAADAALQRSLGSLVAVAESYPDLKASGNFLQLQQQLAETENQISFARQYYNDAVRTLNTATQTVPWMWFAGLAGVSKRDFYEAPVGDEAVPRIEF